MGTIDSVESEINLKVNLEEGQIVQTIDAIGKLDCIIINTDQKVEVLIMSDHGYTIMNRTIKTGVEYIAPRTRAVTQMSDRMQLVDIPFMEKFNLNEKITITLIGPKQTNVGLILRFT